MRLSRSRMALPVLALGIAGAVGGTMVATAQRGKYESHGTIVMSPAGDNAHASRLQMLFDRAQSSFAAGDATRANMAVTRTPDANEVRIAYRHTDPHRAQATVQTLMSRVIEANVEVPAPPGRSGVKMTIASPSDLPTAASRPRLPWLAAFGLAGGALLGLVLGTVRRPGLT